MSEIAVLLRWGKMMDQAQTTRGVRLDKALRLTFWCAAAIFLLSPLVAKRFTGEVRWEVEDFIFAGVLIGIVGLCFETTMRMSRSWTYRSAVGFAVAASFLTVWANAAVGLIGDGGSVHNLLFLIVVIAAAGAALATRLRPARMVIVTLAAAFAHLAISVAGATLDPLGALLSAVFASFWFVAAGLFGSAEREQR
jgi:hypothetical protein